MESVECTTCAAMVAVPPREETASGAEYYKCVCCEHLLPGSAFHMRDETSVRRAKLRCLQCMEGPERKLRWHKEKLPLRKLRDPERALSDWIDGLFHRRGRGNYVFHTIYLAGLPAAGHPLQIPPSLRFQKPSKKEGAPSTIHSNMATRNAQEPTSAPIPPTSRPQAPSYAKPKTGFGIGVPKARKGKKKLPTRAPKSAGPASAVKKSARRALPESDEEDLEDKAPPPPAKKSKTTPAAVSKPVTTVEATRTAPPPSEQGFDLSTFMASFEPGSTGSGATTAVIQHAPSNGAQSEVQRLRGLLAIPTVHVDSVRDRGVVTAPNTNGELPPREVCYVTSASYPEGSKKAKEDYNPPQAHMLAASRMCRAFGAEPGKSLSAMPFVLWMRELECVKFQASGRASVKFSARPPVSLPVGTSMGHFTNQIGHPSCTHSLHGRAATIDLTVRVDHTVTHGSSAITDVTVRVDHSATHGASASANVYTTGSRTHGVCSEKLHI
ncbi:unnamed protein product [Phytophthora fragariaefolia]|uniref:Unnamed protein product n=1 Tax=Phytophthora fragariaefolia TaxID=1490495 RepID=A0A9W6XSS8_9STRA|nr:unnamed protein product [Phytophthora fragariaefolia]